MGYNQRRSDAIDRLIEVKDWLSEHENERREGEKRMKNFEQITKSQLCHAQSVLEDKQRIMTQYRYLFTNEERRANGIAILAIEKQMEYLKAEEREEKEK